MILDRRQSRWAVFTAAGTLVLLAVYVAYVVISANGARGGSAAGLVFGSLGAGVMVFECLLGLRKRYPASPFGRVKTWLSAHVWLGLMAWVLIVMHSGFRWGRGLSAVLMWLLLVVVASGILGVVLQNFIPRRMTETVARETIFEQIPTVIYGLRTEADERVEFITADLGIEEEASEFVRAGGVKQYFDPEQKKSAGEKVRAVVEKRKSSPQIVVEETARQAFRAHYLQEIRPFLNDEPSQAARRLFDGPERVRAYFSHLRVMMPVAAHDVIRDLEEICDERRQLALQVRLHWWMHGWLLVHAPLSFALLVLSAVHAVLSLRY
jgi:hypothetical protein